MAVTERRGRWKRFPEALRRRLSRGGDPEPERPPPNPADPDPPRRPSIGELRETRTEFIRRRLREARRPAPSSEETSSQLRTTASALGSGLRSAAAAIAVALARGSSRDRGSRDACPRGLADAPGGSSPADRGRAGADGPRLGRRLRARPAGAVLGTRRRSLSSRRRCGGPRARRRGWLHPSQPRSRHRPGRGRLRRRRAPADAERPGGWPAGGGNRPRCRL